jgi:branched-chain amino acid transport system ATP-binding protein
MIINIDNLGLAFGGLTALDDVSIDLDEGEILGLIGPNGAGKTSLFNAVTGIYKPSSGKVHFEDREVTGWPSHRIAQIGIARTFQHVMVFPELTCLENVIVGTHCRTKSGFAAILCKTRKECREKENAAKRAGELLGIIGLTEKATELARNLSYGEQRRLDIARSLATEPKVFLLDEPAAGLTMGERIELRALVLKLQQLGIAIILIEHDMKFVMGLVHRVVVLNYGKKIAEGSPKEIQANQQVAEAYLGRSLSRANH